MNCIEARRMVTQYVNKELSVKETEAFLDHIEYCSDCMDELDIYFTVYRALNSLDTGEHHEFNFKKMLAEDIRMERKTIFRKKVAAVIRLLLLLTLTAALLFGAYTWYESEYGEGTGTGTSMEIPAHRLLIRPMEQLKIGIE